MRHPLFSLKPYSLGLTKAQKISAEWAEGDPATAPKG